MLKVKNTFENTKLFKSVGLNREIENLSVKHEPRKAWRVIATYLLERSQSDRDTANEVSGNKVSFGGRSGIRTHGAIACTPALQAGAFDHSAILPLISIQNIWDKQFNTLIKPQ